MLFIKFRKNLTKPECEVIEILCKDANGQEVYSYLHAQIIPKRLVKLMLFIMVNF